MTKKEAFKNFLTVGIKFGIDKIYDDFESRTCEKCEYFHGSKKENFGICEKGIASSFDIGDFGCVKFKLKSKEK